VTSAPTSSTAVRIPDAAVWHRVPDLRKRALIGIVAPFAPDCEFDHERTCFTVATGTEGTESIKRVASLPTLKNIDKPPEVTHGCAINSPTHFACLPAGVSR
jgi:hypothetical protein